MKNALSNGANVSGARRTALSGTLTPPPAPEMTTQPSSMAQTGAPQQQGTPQGGQGPQAPPAPTHQQTVAALRHFQAVLGELSTLLKNPDLGKADLKSAIIDGTTKLVAERVIPPNDAVTQLATVPDRPFDQKQWVMNHLQQTMLARNAVLSHHAAAFAGQGPEPTPSADNHMADINGMMQSHYPNAGSRGMQ
jgi:hypothetical protein